MAGGDRPKRVTRAVVAICLASGYLASLTFNLRMGESAGVWTSPGFLAGAVMLLSGPLRIATLGLCLGGNVAIALWLGGALAPSILFPLVSLTEAVITAHLAWTFCGARSRRLSLRALILIPLAAIMPAAIVGGLLGGAILAAQGGRPFLEAWAEWVLPTALGLAIVVPALLLAARWPQYRDFRRGRTETVGLLAGFAALCGAVAWQTELPLFFAIFPAVTLVAFRLGPPGAAVAGFLVGVVSLPMAALRHGPAMLASGLDMGGRVRLAQLFVVAALFTGLATAGALADHARLRRLMLWRDQAARAARIRARAAEERAAAARELQPRPARERQAAG